MEPLELVGDQIDEPVGEYLIFTHATKSRLAVVTLFATYSLVFGLFTNFVNLKLRELQELPEVFASAQGGLSQWLIYGSMGLGWLLALLLLLYLAYATIDIWGLQVWLSPYRIVVKNTVLGELGQSFSGVGSVDLGDVVAIRGQRFSTQIETEHRRVSFSPVDRLELLISRVIEYAPNATLEI